jgi:hypothetical protein
MMQPLRKLREALQFLADSEHYLFTGSDLAQWSAPED